MATLHQAKFMGFSSIVNTKSARPKGWSPKQKKGLILIRSGFGAIHRPNSAKISAITQVLTFFFFFGDHPFGFAGFSIKKSGQALKKRDVW